MLIHLFVGTPDKKFGNSKYNCVLVFFVFDFYRSVGCFIGFQQQ